MRVITFDKDAITETARLKLHMETQYDSMDEKCVAVASYLADAYPDVFSHCRHPSVATVAGTANTKTDLHFQWFPLVGTLVQVIRGRALLMTLNLRCNSSTEWHMSIADSRAASSGKDSNWLWVPAGIALGFCFLEDSEIQLVRSEKRNQQSSFAISTSDPDIIWRQCSPDLLSPCNAAKRCAGSPATEAALETVTLEEWKKGPNYTRFSYDALACDRMSEDGSAPVEGDARPNRTFLSCHYLHSGYLQYHFNRDASICSSSGRRIKLDAPACGVPFDVAQLFAFRRELHKKLNSGERMACSNCSFVRPYATDISRTLRYIAFAPSHLCNLKCDYCGERWDEARQGGTVNDKGDWEDAIAVLNEYASKGYIDRNTRIDLLGGEPTVIKGFDRFVEHARVQFKNFMIYTNSVILSGSILRLLDSDANVKIVTSVDAGTRETYELLKGGDHLMSVLGTIKSYARLRPGAVQVKYILLPQNSEKKERDEFLRNMKECGVRKITIDFDGRADGECSEGILRTAGHFRHDAEKLGFFVTVNYSILERICSKRNIGNYRHIIDSAYKNGFPDYRGVPTRATVPEFAYGKILEVKKADNGGLWVHGWAYDRFLERQADEIAVFWKGAPIFSGVCRFVMPRIRKTELTDFSFNAAEADFANEVLADKHLLKAYARFGDGWFELASSWQAPAGD